MLNNVSVGVGRSLRNVIINHPNTWEAQIFRKKVERLSNGNMGGLPTLGGLGVLSGEDEEKISFEHLVNGYALSADAFGVSPMMDRQDADDMSGNAPEFRLLIEPAEPSGMPGYFDIKTGDVVYIVVTDAIRLAFEVVRCNTNINMAPFSMVYICNRRADIDVGDGNNETD